MTVSFGVTAAEVDFLPQSYWQASQQFVSLALLFFVCWFVKETNYYQEKDVVVPTYVEKIVHGRVDLEALKRNAGADAGEDDSVKVTPGDDGNAPMKADSAEKI